MPAMDKHVRIDWQQDLDFAAVPPKGTAVALAGDQDSDGFTPADLVLVALAGCSGMDVKSILVKKRQAVERYSVSVRGRQREEYPRIFEQVDVEHVVEGDALDDAAVRRAVELSATRYCLVSAHLAAGETVVHHSYRIRDGAGERTGEVITTGPRGAGLSASPATAA